MFFKLYFFHQNLIAVRMLLNQSAVYWKETVWKQRETADVILMHALIDGESS